MDLDFEKQKPCPVVEVDGVIEKGKQFDLDISLPDVYQKKYHFLSFLIKKRLLHLFR